MGGWAGVPRPHRCNSNVFSSLFTLHSWIKPFPSFLFPPGLNFGLGTVMELEALLPLCISFDFGLGAETEGPVLGPT